MFDLLLPAIRQCNAAVLVKRLNQSCSCCGDDDGEGDDEDNGESFEDADEGTSNVDRVGESKYDGYDKFSSKIFVADGWALAHDGAGTVGNSKATKLRSNGQMLIDRFWLNLCGAFVFEVVDPCSTTFDLSIKSGNCWDFDIGACGRNQERNGDDKNGGVGNHEDANNDGSWDCYPLEKRSYLRDR